MPGNSPHLSEHEQIQIKTIKSWLHDNTAAIGNIAIFASLEGGADMQKSEEISTICEKTSALIGEALAFSRKSRDSTDLLIYLTTFREDIRQEIAKIISLVNNFKGFDQDFKQRVGESLKHESDLNSEQIDHSEVSKIIAQLGKEYGGGLNITLDYDNQPIFADKTHFIRILMNIFSNARKYTPAGTTVSLQIKKQSQNTLLLIVDDGPGFSGYPQKLIKMHAQDKAEHATQGFGIGLAYCHDIIQDHGGKMELFNRTDLPGEKQTGAVFVITFPDSSPRQSQVNFQENQQNKTA